MTKIVLLIPVSMLIGIALSIGTSWLFNVLTSKYLSFNEVSRMTSRDVIEEGLKKYKKGVLSEDDMPILWSSMMDYVSSTKSKDHALAYLSVICKNADPQLKSLCVNSKKILEDRFS